MDASLETYAASAGKLFECSHDPVVFRLMNDHVYDAIESLTTILESTRDFSGNPFPEFVI